mmetsp:Transcript_96205/g.310366  ORF Transcript_96205/g.310366 Transcript_96205/m.310366 type:complete len:206 (-) Transcript_96205:654-1271(-)
MTVGGAACIGAHRPCSMCWVLTVLRCRTLRELWAQEPIGALIPLRSANGSSPTMSHIISARQGASIALASFMWPREARCTWSATSGARSVCPQNTSSWRVFRCCLPTQKGPEQPQTVFGISSWVIWRGRASLCCWTTARPRFWSPASAPRSTEALSTECSTHTTGRTTAGAVRASRTERVQLSSGRIGARTSGCKPLGWKRAMAF